MNYLFHQPRLDPPGNWMQQLGGSEHRKPNSKDATTASSRGEANFSWKADLSGGGEAKGMV